MKPHRTLFSTVHVFGILFLIAACGCDMDFADWGRAKAEKTFTDEAVLLPGGALDVLTQSGSIAITGADVVDCNIVARVVAHAPTEEEAQQLAEEVRITLELADNVLKVRADKPLLANNRSITVSYTITCPRHIDLLCQSDYGNLRTANLVGTVKARTSSGSIRAVEIEGPIDLNTSYGSIKCTDIVGPTALLQSSSGSISVTGLKCSAKARTAYGSISCRESSGGSLDLKTKSGRVTLVNVSFTDCGAETEYGSVASRAFTGKNVKLHSSSGDVGLANAQADSIDLHTSYGRVEAREITTDNLLAGSGSGSIDIVCTESCPANLKAKAKTTYGSVDFKAPSRFSGEVRLITGYGSVQTALPLTVTGRIDKKDVAGRIGEGTGEIHLEAGSGSVDLR